MSNAPCGHPRDWVGLYRKDYDLATPESTEHPAIYGIIGMWGKSINGSSRLAQSAGTLKVLELKFVPLVPHDNKGKALAISFLASVSIAIMNLKFPNGVLTKVVAVFAQGIVEIGSRLHSWGKNLSVGGVDNRVVCIALGGKSHGFGHLLELITSARIAG